MGAVTPLGNDVKTTWQNLSGRAVRAPARSRSSTRPDYPVTFACELKDFEPTDWIEHKTARRMDRFAQMVVAAARQAADDSGLDIAAASDRIGASIATGIGGLQSFQDCTR